MKKEVDPAKIKARDAYNSASDNFDNEALSFWSLFGSNTIKRLHLSSGARVLDLACGSGASAIPAAVAVGPTGKVIAVDLAENLLKLGQEKAGKLKLNNIEFISGDMTDLDLSEESFDAVVCVFGIFFVPDMEELVRSIWRFVKPGGKLAVTTWGPRLFEPASTIWSETIKAERPDLYVPVNPWDRLIEVESVKSLFLTLETKEVEVFPEDGTHPLKSPEDWWTIVVGSGYRWTVDKMGPEASARVKNKILDRIKDNNIKAIETNVIYAIVEKNK